MYSLLINNEINVSYNHFIYNVIFQRLYKFNVKNDNKKKSYKTASSICKNRFYEKNFYDLSEKSYKNTKRTKV